MAGGGAQGIGDVGERVALDGDDDRVGVVEDGRVVGGADVDGELFGRRADGEAALAADGGEVVAAGQEVDGVAATGQGGGVIAADGAGADDAVAHRIRSRLWVWSGRPAGLSGWRSAWPDVRAWAWPRGASGDRPASCRSSPGTGRPWLSAARVPPREVVRGGRAGGR